MRVPWSARLLAIALLLIEGLSGAGVGLSLVGGMIASNAGGTGAAIAGGVLGYGLALLVGALGMVLRRPWGWPVAVGTVVVGLAILVVVLGMAGWRDPVIGGGIVIWLVTLVALVAARERP